MFVAPEPVILPVPKVLERVRGFKCPISFHTTENPVYLKGCEHFFDRALIEQFFREKFANSDIAPCPMCNRPYSIIKFLPEGREQAIARLFERILIVPLVTHEINRKLAKWENHNQQLLARDQRIDAYEKKLATRDQRIDQLIKVHNEQIAIIENKKNKIKYLKQEVSEAQQEVSKAQQEVQAVTKEKERSDEANSKKLAYNEKVSNLSLGIIGAACIPVMCVAPAAGGGMLIVTAITFLATNSAKESHSKSTDLTIKKQQ